MTHTALRWTHRDLHMSACHVFELLLYAHELANMVPKVREKKKGLTAYRSRGLELVHSATLSDSRKTTAAAGDSEDNPQSGMPPKLAKESSAAQPMSWQRTCKALPQLCSHCNCCSLEAIGSPESAGTVMKGRTVWMRSCAVHKSLQSHQSCNEKQQSGLKAFFANWP